jgi:branched-chain amino acid transport system permease protein
MDVALVSILSGISYGVVLFLVAAGLSFVLGLMGIVNIAHGALVMTGAYVGLNVAKATRSLVLGGLAGALLAGLVGLFLERGFLRKLYRFQLDQILVTFGFVYILANVHLWVYGAWPLEAFIPSALSGSFAIGRFSFSAFRMVIMCIGVVLCPVLWWIQDRTKIGAIIRAGMDDPDMVAVMGINLRPINIAVFFAAACLAGFAGVLGAFPLGGVNLGLGQEMVFLAIAVVVVGGVGSIQGAFASALIIGVFSSVAGTYLPAAAMFVPYFLMIVILIFRPQGLFGRTGV